MRETGEHVDELILGMYTQTLQTRYENLRKSL